MGGKLYLIDGEIWRIICVDEEGAELHLVNSWRTKHYSSEQWEIFIKTNTPVGYYD